MKLNKNIAVICNYNLNPNRIGGMDRFFVAYDGECKKLGYKISWFFAGGRKYDFYDDLEVHICSKDLYLEFLDFHQTNKYNIVITHFVELCTPFFKTIKTINEPYIISVDHNPRPIGGFRIKKRAKNKLKGILYSKYIDLLIGVSQYTTNCILNDFGMHLQAKTKVVYNGIATDVYLKRKAENFGKFIVASHLRSSKGIQDLIKAVSLLNSAAKDKMIIDIYGEGPIENELKELVRSLELDTVFTFKGSTPELPNLYKNYSFLLQPTYMECFSLSILESLASNVPVVTTLVGGNEEIVINGVNGFIFPAKDVVKLSGLLDEILNRSKKIQKNTFTEIEENFNLSRMVNEHIKLLPCI
ncbi:glycosyltransferase family 4 protein [Gillisia sp. CAL575]|uniref:glycosyltransferase family 4 protein n=1 Tax=Gillisia sp. CAL575 TaxID=985255 RepID=UPI000558CEF5|nr:glycosyltransferase family 4 protein [Gillisia sp. CAL575]